MAGACSTLPCGIRPFPSTTLLSRRPLLLSSSLITSRPRKFTKRKNYLRPKILKTLTKPYTTPLETPIQHIPILSPDLFDGDELMAPENHELLLPEFSQPDGFVDVNFSEAQIHDFPSELENQQIKLSEPAGVVNVRSGIFGKSSLLNFGLWIVGAFVFQTICSVWLLDSADYNGKHATSDQNGYKNEVLEMDSKGKSKYKMKTFVNRDGKQSVENMGVAFVDEAEMEKKIKEIQRMAREAREKERLESKETNFDEESEDEIEDSDFNIGVKKEVGERLSKLRKGLEKISNKQPTKFVTNPVVDVEKNDRDDGSNLDEKELNAALMFKRKHKFRDFSSKPSNKPKGFMGPGHQNAGGNSEKTLKGKTEVLNNENGEVNVVKAVNNSLEKRGRDIKGIASDMKEAETGFYISARNNGSSLFEAVDAEESSIKESATISSSGNTSVEVVDSKESCSMKSTTAMDEHRNANRNEEISRKKVKDQKVVKPNGGMESGNDTDFWWFRLPYVLGIHMRRGHEDGGSEGLFALKSSSEMHGTLSHTVAFEDRADATNFCYLLQSFFEGLGDFDTEIIPLSVKELSEAVRSHTRKVLVVKKGILKLYAGQPLGEAEMALRSLVELE